MGQLEQLKDLKKEYIRLQSSLKREYLFFVLTLLLSIGLAGVGIYSNEILVFGISFCFIVITALSVWLIYNDTQSLKELDNEMKLASSKIVNRTFLSRNPQRREGNEQQAG